MRIKAKFTLIELLVVVAIIGILAAILLPALARAKYNARKAVCMSNLKNWGGAIIMYSDDFDGQLPGGEKAGGARNPHDIPLPMYNILQDDYDFPVAFFSCPLEENHPTPTVSKSSNQAWIAYGYYRQRQTKAGADYMPDLVAGPSSTMDHDKLERELASDDWTYRNKWISKGHFWGGKPESSNTLWLDGHVYMKDFSEVIKKFTSSRPADIWW